MVGGGGQQLSPRAGHGYSSSVPPPGQRSYYYGAAGNHDGGMRNDSRPKFQTSRHSDSVQLSIDIPYNDHPYLIGPRGRKCQNLMERLKTLVHFPDSNRRQDGPKLNTVLISGAMHQAEEMRRQLRARTPIRLHITLEQLNKPELIASRMEEAITERSLPIRFTYSEGFKNAVLKTEWRNEVLFVRFCNEFLASPNTDPIYEIYTLALPLLPLVNPWNAQLSMEMVQYVRDVYSCHFYYPPKEQFIDKAPYYFVRGDSVARVLQTARFLLGMTMFQASFSLPAHAPPVPESMLDEWRSNMLVHVSIEPVYGVHPHTYYHNSNCSSAVNSASPSPVRGFDNRNGGNGAPNHTSPTSILFHQVTLLSFEFCINNIYSIRSMLLGTKNLLVTPEYDFMESVAHYLPSDVFYTCKLFYPLYSIADEGAIGLDESYTARQFFNHFYGGPYSIRHSTAPDKELTALLMNMLDISSDGSDGRSHTRDYSGSSTLEHNSSSKEQSPGNQAAVTAKLTLQLDYSPKVKEVGVNTVRKKRVSSC